MAYNKMEDQPGGADSAPMEREDTFFLPADFDGLASLNPGDTVTFRVVSKQDNGDVEVERVGPETTEEKPMMEDLRDTMAGPPPTESEY